MLKLIFVDIDGVLNNMLDKTSYFCLDPSTYGISPVNVGRLVKLIQKTGAQIVWCTAWRQYPDDHSYYYNGMKFDSHFKETRELLKDYEFKEIPKCPHISKKTKKDDILGFFYLLQDKLGVNMADVNFAILDDAKNHGLEYFDRHFFFTDVETGLTDSDVEAVSLYLNKEKD